MSDFVNNLGPPVAESSTSAPKKRTRVQFSCTACRLRKLKCCRTYPCTNCKKRGEAASCTYVGRGPRGKAQHGSTSPSLVQDRLQHLENLVMSMAQKQKPENPEIEFNVDPTGGHANYATPSSVREGVSPSQDTGTMVVKDEGTSYIDSANWRAILEEINGVKEYIDENEDNSDDEATETHPLDKSSPALLLGSGKPIPKEELLVDIPPRSITDRLVSRFLKTSEPLLVMLHIPTFYNEYEQFWRTPHEMSYSWISMLYSIVTLSVSMYHRGQEPLPLNMADTMITWNIFRKRAAQCLVQANYIHPGRYKCEALFLYSMCEFYRSQDAQVGVSYLHGIAVRLAMRMGYHRDARHYPMLSAWEGEMRRRFWALLCQLDTLVSFQVGLPRTIQPWQYDTELPSNLLDTDFHKDSLHLPPSRPVEQRTACSYTNGKAQIMKVFGQITDLAYSREHTPYEEILEIDRRLVAAKDGLPSFLRIRPMTQSLADPTELVLRRYTMDLLYLKSRAVLHRRYIAENDGKYSYSRTVCLNAAKETLRHGADIWTESMPGGQLYTERYFINSLQNTDFLLSAMILCLELSQDDQRGTAARLSAQERADFLLLLETSHRVFKDSRRRSVDTQRAFAALTIMLGRVKGSSVQNVSMDTDQPTPQMNIPSQPVFPVSMDQQQDPMYSAVGDMPPAMYNPTSTPSYSSLGVIEDMFNSPASLDWRLYDSRISGFEMATQNNVWNSDATGEPFDYEFACYPSDLQPSMDQNFP